MDNSEIYQRYELERNKRLRNDGRKQYHKLDGQFANFNDAPWIKQSNTREVVNLDTQTLIVGGGLGGILAAINLRKKNIDDFIIVDNGEDFGGVWYWNRYPGCMCDIESYIYLPLLEEMDFIPSSKYIPASEIATYLRKLSQKYKLYERTYFQTAFKQASWDEERGRWTSMTSLGDSIISKYVVLSTGFLSTPKLPSIPGIADFKGKSFHTSRWDYDYTGGNANGDLQRLSDKNVAVIGTGASAVQCIPHLASYAKQLLVFQRTPVAVGGQCNTPTDVEWFKNQRAGWQKARSENFNRLMEGIPEEVNLVDDEWTDLTKYFDYENKNLSEAWENADLRKMDEIRKRVIEKVKDEALARKLMPWYKWLCKRPCFHGSYLDSFNQENVHLIDTSGKGVDKITEDSIIVDDQRYPLDCIIYATGYEVGTAFESRCNLKMFGRNGVSLTEVWGKSHQSLHGFMTRNFPNMLIMSLNQSALAVNFSYMISEQAKHVTYIIEQSQRMQLWAIEPYAEAEAAWSQEVLKTGARTFDYHVNCTPSFFNEEGKLNDDAIKKGPYGGGALNFVEILNQWREKGDMAGLELTSGKIMT
ncbi:flavin-containing monooxygenase [Serratia ficaria]|uniref:flavin-containing monooxygenase n=1 Tax=Serratia ficaria TaxID=61651 RepID=UPI0021C7CE37|nr:NAD(P)/FAD-dependent oxidoreductase [Serratia ficaria]